MADAKISIPVNVQCNITRDWFRLRIGRFVLCLSEVTNEGGMEVLKEEDAG